MKIVLHGERPISWNEMYSGIHWTKRKEEADRVHHLIWVAIQEQRLKLQAREYLVYSQRVDIHVTAYFKCRPQDPDNICSKMYIDGLIGDVIVDDTREFVRKVTVQSEIDKDNPRVEIEITEIEYEY